MRTEEFDNAWRSLSAIQRTAAEWNDGPLLVLAGPGSGKTRVLTCRIARILNESQDDNFRILGLTFTNKAADEMRSRVTDFAPGQEDRVFLGTFHSFCAEILRQHGVHVGINPNFKIYSQEGDLQAVLSEAVAAAKNTSDIVSDNDKKSLPLIQRMKSLLIPPESCQSVFANPQIGERMGVVYPAYEAELSKRNALDFNSLILKAHLLLTKFPAIAKRYRTIYSFICIDEFQDTNRAQYGLVRALTGDQFTNVFVVADDDQIIYQWNGASHKRLGEFVKDFSPEILQLPMNYRCPPEIVVLANDLIRHNFNRSPDKKPLEAFRTSTGETAVRLLECFPDLESEGAGIAADVKRHHGGHLGSVAVLARNRKLLDVVEQALRNEELPAVISQRKDAFESTPFVWLHSILRLANDRQDRECLEAICGSFAQLTAIAVDLDEVVSQAQAANHDYLQHWIKLARPECYTESLTEVIEMTSRCLGEGRDFQAFSRFALSWFAQIAQSRVSDENCPQEEIFARYDEERLVWEELMKQIVFAVGDGLTLGAFLQELQMRSKETIPDSNSVVLMTIHAAKGKEFEHVYLVGLVEDELPSFQSLKKGDGSPELEEERRNCFVAITRAIETLTLSYARKCRGWRKEPSRFLIEMGFQCQ